MPTTAPGLSKSRFMAGLQCAKRLWLQAYEPELASPPDASAQARLDAGTEIGGLAHRLFPGGVLVDEPYDQHARAVERTARLVADPAVPAIFEAAFLHQGVRIRVDVLERLGEGRFGLREVKSTSSPKPEHHPDVAVQLFVLEGCGLDVPSIELVHVDSSYVRGEDGIEWQRFFARADLTAEARAALAGVRARVADLHGVLERSAAPAIAPWRHCTQPYACEFQDHCKRGLPDDWILKLPGLRERTASALAAKGVARIREIPEDFELSDLQRRVRDVVIAGEPFVSPDLATALEEVRLPALYLDFETFMPVVPPWPGTHPYQTIPFQWSLHRQAADGSLAQDGFLAEGPDDLRRTLVDALLGKLEAHADLPILVFSGYERRVLDGLGGEHPELAHRLSAAADRLVDLLPIVKPHIYAPAFDGSFSLKSVAPALAPGFGYDDLDGIADGDAAQKAFAELLAGRLDPADTERTRAALLAYCERDTLALVELHRALVALGRAPRRTP